MRDDDLHIAAAQLQPQLNIGYPAEHWLRSQVAEKQLVIDPGDHATHHWMRLVSCAPGLLTRESAEVYSGISGSHCTMLIFEESECSQPVTKGLD